MKILCKADYEKSIADTRDARMAWWRDARFGMFVHYGLYSQLGRGEWVMCSENYRIEDYKPLADTFNPREGAPYEWAALAKAAGMKYMVLTTRHHEGFSLWDSKVNPYNSVNYGPKRDIVAEFVDACRKNDLKIGFYSTLMDWYHPDATTAAYDSEARKRFNDYIYQLNYELLTQYGKIDILWYDVSAPMESHEGWNSLELNQKLRALQPDIIINDRSKLAEDFGTPEGAITPDNQRDWEACMTFNDISWGYVDSVQAAPYSYTPQRIIMMLHKAAQYKGNLLLNIGPEPDGTVPKEAIEPLKAVGEWLKQNGEAIYGKDRIPFYTWGGGPGTGLCTAQGNNLYVIMPIYSPKNGEMFIGGHRKKLLSAEFISDGSKIEFEYQNGNIRLYNLPDYPKNVICGIPVMKLVFDGPPEFDIAPRYGQIHGGKILMD